MSGIRNLNPTNVHQKIVLQQIQSMVDQSEDPQIAHHALETSCTVLQQKDQDPQALWQFLDLYLRARSDHTVHKKNITNVDPLRSEHIDHIEQIEARVKEKGETNWETLAVIKLNGGLGTSMGCEGPKSLIDVWPNHTFLDIIIKQQQFLNQTYNSRMPLLLMNSIFTHDACHETLEGVPFVKTFMQHQFPRLNAHTWGPIQCQDEMHAYYPPGHGDVYGALLQSGHVDTLLDNGYEVVFISNSDNLAALPDPKILGYMLDNNLDFLMEVTAKTALDVKGGALVLDNGKNRLLERAEVSEIDIPLFEDINTFKLFNTNNLWVNLRSLKKKLSQGLELPVIQNKKHVEGHDVIQLETAMGSAISVFERSAAIEVNRDRFMPIKKTSDLFLLQSDLITKDLQTGKLTQNINRKSKDLPEIKFCDEYKHVSGYDQYVKSIPSLLQVMSLEIKKPTSITADMALSGHVVL